MSRSLFYFIVLLEWPLLSAAGHPVAQGSMEIVTGVDHVRIVANVSSEEAFVAEALGHGKSAASLNEVWSRHGDYLLDHLEVAVDGQLLTGKVEAIAPAKAAEQIRYDLSFEIPPRLRPPRSVTLKQHVLNEFSFAPGNSWEATYVVRLPSAYPPRDGVLFTSREPLSFNCSAKGAGPDADENAALAFVRHGIHHILSGYDHLLFVAGLVLAVTRLWDLVKVITAFTLAHSLTLTLSVLDVVRLSNRIVEPMIAASIVFVALQNLAAPSQGGGRLRLMIAFGFGLFHGLGFAGGLLSAMAGMQTTAVATAIIAFSVGVELGHQIVALPLFAAMKTTQRYGQRTCGEPGNLHFWMLRLGSGVICVAGAAYLVAALRWVT
jgi:hypothetical protein